MKIVLDEKVTHKEFGPMMDEFVSFASDRLGLKSLPTIRYKDQGERFASFGGYNPSTSEIVIQTKDRHPMDVLRTLAHELVHHKQRENGEITVERSSRIHDLTKRLNKKDNEPEETNETEKQPETQTSPIAGW